MAVDWTKVDEIRLLRWVAEFKPAGLHKHFHMYCIVERMNRPDKYPVVLLQKETVKSGKIFTASEIWEKLTQYYNLDTMDRAEGCGPFDENKDFELPWDEYGDLILDHAQGEAESEEENERKQEIKREDLSSVTDAPEIHDIEKEDQPNTSSGSINNAKRRSTRLRKSSRLNHSGSASDDEDASNVGSGGSEPDGEEEELQTDSNGNKVNKRDQPLAKRTRHSASATTNTTDNEVSPRRKKRKPDETTPPLPPIVKQETTPASTQATPPVRTSSRVSSRLRNKK